MVRAERSHFVQGKLAVPRLVCRYPCPWVTPVERGYRTLDSELLEPAVRAYSQITLSSRLELPLHSHTHAL